MSHNSIELTICHSIHSHSFINPKRGGAEVRVRASKTPNLVALSRTSLVVDDDDDHKMNDFLWWVSENAQINTNRIRQHVQAISPFAPCIRV